MHCIKKSCNFFAFLYVLGRPKSKKVVYKKYLCVCMSVVSITHKRIDLRCSNYVCGLQVAMGPVVKVFVKIEHAQKVAAIEKYVFLAIAKNWL